jgi:two-component system response regulator HydG
VSDDGAAMIESPGVPSRHAGVHSCGTVWEHRQQHDMKTRLKVLVVDDEPALREVLTLRIADWGHEVRTAPDARSALQDVEGHPPDVVLCDVVLPGSSGLAVLARLKEGNATLPIVMMTAHGNVDLAVDAMKTGATDFLTKPIDHDALHALLETIAGEVRARERARSLDAQLERQEAVGLVGTSSAMRALRRTIELLAASDAPAIISGESGTGKEVVARAIHELSARRAKTFLAINAAAIPEGLVESEVFGHELGAFTGASRARAGSFELAEGGTLFLDEIGEMPIALQPKLLRVLEDGRARRVGGSRDIRFDVRVLAATNRPPAQAMREGRLREDLFYRLSVFELTIPPLRERISDVALLAQHFMREFGRKHAVRIDGLAEPALQSLESHAWPGNVRELRNVIERAVIVARSGSIERRHLPPYLQGHTTHAPPTVTLPVGATLAQAERALILHALARSGDNKAEAARQLGLDVKTIRNKLRGYAGMGEP